MPIVPGIPASSGGQQPDTPTIGTVTNRTSTSQNVAFTASTYTGKVTPITYRAIAFNSGGTEVGRTGTGTTPPIIVSSLSSNTAYKYQVEAFTPTATSPRTGFSNTVTTPPPPPPPPPPPTFVAPPTFIAPPTFVAPPAFFAPPSFATPP